MSKTAFKSAILVSLILTDLHALQLDERIMTGISDTHIQVGANAFIDEEGNSVVESASLQGATFVPIARVVVESFELYMNTAQLLINFIGSVLASGIDVTSIQIVSDAASIHSVGFYFSNNYKQLQRI